MSATRLYTNLDIPESRNLIDLHSEDESVPKIMDIFKNFHGTMEEQMFHNQWTLKDITEVRKDNIYNNVRYLMLSLLSFEGLFSCATLLTFNPLFVGFYVYIKGNNKWVTTK
jgi:hypothetical protein